MNFIDYHLYINDLHLDINDALQMLQVNDYSPDNPVVVETGQVFGQLESIAAVHGGYVVYDSVAVDKEHGLITIEDKLINPERQVCGYMREAEKIALFVCTAGSGFSSYAKKYNEEGDYLKGFIVDTLGSLVVERAMDWIQQKMEREFSQAGLRITNRYSPGYCNWSVKDQSQLFSLLPENPCNIRLSESSLMIPIKSVSGIIGIGKDVKKRAYACDICKNKTCIYRKVKDKSLVKQG